MSRTHLLGALALAALLSACATTDSKSTVKAETRTQPRLVVLLVIDGLPQWQVTAYRDQLAPDGFRRFLDRGTWFSSAHYSHAHTVTAVGHATFLTGAHPSATGMLSNEWRDPATGASIYCTQDEAHSYIGHKTKKQDGTSPKNLRAESLGDVLKRVSPASKVIAMSAKDRGAILPAGKVGTAYMYMSETGHFASSTYYMKDHPAWVTAFNDARPADKYFKAVWKPLLAEAAYKQSVPDGQPWYSGAGKLPMTIGAGDAPGANFYGSLIGSPFSDVLTLDFARAAIAGEALGQDDAPDILAVSLSGHDYVNHSHGAESRISHDHTLHLDRALQAFFAHLDEKIGKGRYVVALSADHGFMPVPEYSQSRGQGGGRQNPAQLMARINAELSKTFGDGAWLRGSSGNGSLINHALVKEKNVSAAALAVAARDLFRKEPAIAHAWLKTEVKAGLPAGTPFAELLKNHYIDDLSPDIIIVPSRNWLISSWVGGTTHGTPYDYDTHVPIMFYAPGYETGRVDTRVSVIDIAPTLAKMLGIPAPAQSVGNALPKLR
ncbi:MAG: alkaline phosphatase family protein [Betaproteobacteria bacterium]|nr:alkaline phosphatase family protein [Betaproteobacteria bacterium]